MDYWGGGGGGGAKGMLAPPPLELLGGPGPPWPPLFLRLCYGCECFDGLIYYCDVKANPATTYMGNDCSYGHSCHR